MRPNTENNRAKTNAAVALWASRNPVAGLARSHRYRTRKAGAGGSYTAREWRDLLHRFGHTCPRCGRSDRPLTADHIVPVSAGGTSNIDNIQPLCGPCNSAKGARTIRYAPVAGLLGQEQ